MFVALSASPFGGRRGQQHLLQVKKVPFRVRDVGGSPAEADLQSLWVPKIRPDR
jgi:hypothetical protein